MRSWVDHGASPLDIAALTIHEKFLFCFFQKRTGGTSFGKKKQKLSFLARKTQQNSGGGILGQPPQGLSRESMKFEQNFRT
jgi:hypothetical protein